MKLKRLLATVLAGCLASGSAIGSSILSSADDPNAGLNVIKVEDSVKDIVTTEVDGVTYYQKQVIDFTFAGHGSANGFYLTGIDEYPASSGKNGEFFRITFTDSGLQAASNNYTLIINNGVPLTSNGEIIYGDSLSSDYKYTRGSAYISTYAEADKEIVEDIKIADILDKATWHSTQTGYPTGVTDDNKEAGYAVKHFRFYANGTSAYDYNLGIKDGKVKIELYSPLSEAPDDSSSADDSSTIDSSLPDDSSTIDSSTPDDSSAVDPQPGVTVVYDDKLTSEGIEFTPESLGAGKEDAKLRFTFTATSQEGWGAIGLAGKGEGGTWLQDASSPALPSAGAGVEQVIEMTYEEFVAATKLDASAVSVFVLQDWGLSGNNLKIELIEASSSSSEPSSDVSSDEPSDVSSDTDSGTSNSDVASESNSESSSTDNSDGDASSATDTASVADTASTASSASSSGTSSSGTKSSDSSPKTGSVAGGISAAAIICLAAAAAVKKKNG